jgi:dihydrofolate reductase
MILSIIAALSDDGVIGRDGALPWRIPADMARFRALTMGHCVIMGRRTFDSIGGPLAGRTNVILTRRIDFTPPGCLVFHDLESALERCRATAEEIFVIGGAELFRQALPLVDRLHLTLVHGRFEGDTFFPEWSPADFECVLRKDDPGPPPVTFIRLDRRRVPASEMKA